MSTAEHSVKILVLGEARAVHAQRWVEYFRRRGWRVRWLSLPPIPAGVAAESLGGDRWPRAAAIVRAVRSVRRIADEFAPHITSALFLPDYGWLGALAGLHPLVVSAWGSDVLISPEKSILHRHRIRMVLRRADHMFTDAETLARRMLELGAPAARITVAPLGIEDSWLSIGDRRADVGKPPLVVTQNRRLEPLYRVETLLCAAARLKAGAPGRYRFVVIGEGSREASLHALARRLHVDDVLQFLPWLSPSDLQHQIAAADLYVSTASSDGTSVSLLEAMAAGCFPITTNLSATREWIDDGVNGLLFPVGDDESLARQIERAANDPSLRLQARRHNRQVIVSRARWNDNMATVEAAMMEAICRSGKR